MQSDLQLFLKNKAQSGQDQLRFLQSRLDRALQNLGGRNGGKIKTISRATSGCGHTVFNEDSITENETSGSMSQLLCDGG